MAGSTVLIGYVLSISDRHFRVPTWMTSHALDHGQTWMVTLDDGMADLTGERRSDFMFWVAG